MKFVRVAGAAVLAGAAIAALSAFTYATHGKRSHHAKHLSSMTIGEMLPFTGAKSLLSTWGAHGSRAGIYEVNKAGGVLGHKLTAATADTGGDAVDAVPALRQLLIHHPAWIVGPFSLTIEAVVRDFGPNRTPDFMVGGTTQLDHMRYPWVYRMNPSDSTEVVAMAYYAIHHGLKRAAFVFDNSANAQGLVAPLRQAYTKLGGTVVANEEITPGQSSYQTEVENAFSGNPQTVFMAFDPQTAATFFNNVRALGHLNIPFIGEDIVASTDYSKAMGVADAAKYLFATFAAPPGGKAYQHYLADYKHLFHTKQVLTASYNFYDAVVVPALAMTAAHSTNPKVWLKKVVAVSNPPGVKCSTYGSCVALLKKGKKINYDGAGGPIDFNRYHNVFGGFTVTGFDASGNLKPVGYVTAKQIASVVAKGG